MNEVILIGRLTKDPEVKNTSTQKAFCTFSLAVDRSYKDQNGQRQADFINCVAWGSTCGLIAHNFKKGDKFGIIGELQSRSYDDNNGQRRYVTEVKVNHVEFVTGKPTEEEQKPSIAPEQAELPLEDAEEMDDADLPFLL